jgi:hypothetical protein
VIELPKNGPLRWIGIGLVFVIAICCVVVSMLPFALDDTFYLKKSIHLRQTGVIIPGTVSAVQASDTNPNDPGDITYFRLTVEYTVDGKTYSVRNQEFISGYGVGDSIDVIYDPADPATAQVDIFSERWFDPIMEMSPF